jgi:heme-degrading monooxygenase HmoA
MRSAAEEILEEMSPRVKARNGFRSVNFLSDDEAGEYGAFVLWETKEDAEVAKEALLPILQSKLTGIAKSPPTIRLFEVIEPKT